MRAFIATVDLVIRADSQADAQNRLHRLLTDEGVHADQDSVLVDWSYVPSQRNQGDWPRAVDLVPEWLDVLEGERDADLLFEDRRHIEPMLIASTAHLDAKMQRLLESLAPGIIEYDWGWFVRVDAELDAPAVIQGFARERGCVWIKFDSDGPVLTDLATFGA